METLTQMWRKTKIIFNDDIAVVFQCSYFRSICAEISCTWLAENKMKELTALI